MSDQPTSASGTRLQAGNMPVVLVAGHGGDARPDEIPDQGRGLGLKSSVQAF